MNPYKTLNVPVDAVDETIRHAYLKAIKECPQEQDAEQFRKLTAAYESIKDIDSRIHHLIHPAKPEGDSPLAVVVDFARQEPPVPTDLNKLKRFLRSLV